MKDILYLETHDQIKAISNPLRMAILKVFSAHLGEPLPIKAIAEALDENPSKLHYHVKELEKHGILEIGDTREINGITERFYQPAAKQITVRKELLPPDEQERAGVGIVLNILENARNDLVRISGSPKASEGIVGESAVVCLTPEEREDFLKKVHEMALEYGETPKPGGRPYNLVMILYPLLSGRKKEGE